MLATLKVQGCYAHGEIAQYFIRDSKRPNAVEDTTQMKISAVRANCTVFHQISSEFFNVVVKLSHLEDKIGATRTAKPHDAS